MPDGEKRVMQIDQLDSYTVNGQIFEKKELYVNGKSTGRVAFMQLIGVRGNLKIYKNVAFDPELVTADKKRNDFYVYMGEEVYLDVDRKALPNVLNFFGLKWSYMWSDAFQINPAHVQDFFCLYPNKFIPNFSF